MSVMRPRRLRRFLVLTAILAATAAGIGAPAPLSAVVDGTARDGAEALKDGNADWLIPTGSLQLQNINVPVSPFVPLEDRPIIEFDLSTVTAPVGGAILTMPVAVQRGPYPFSVQVYGYSGDGVLGLGDFRAGTLLTTVEYPGSGSLTVDVTTFIEQLRIDRAGFAGFELRIGANATAPGGGPYLALNSRSVPPAAQLAVVPAVPALPGAVLLVFGLGLAALGWFALDRRRGAGASRSASA